METKFNFKSQICTSREQSERLLALGLKKETADMCLDYTEVGWIEEDGVNVGTITQLQPIAHPPVMLRETPAWGLHRLIELAYGNWKEDIAPIYLGNSYDMLIGRIEFQVLKGIFNKEYLV